MPIKVNAEQFLLFKVNGEVKSEPVISPKARISKGACDTLLKNEPYKLMLFGVLQDSFAKSRFAGNWAEGCGQFENGQSKATIE